VEDFVSHLDHRLYGADALHLFSFAGIDALDSGVGVRADDELGHEHARPVHVVGILGPAAGLFGPVQPVEALADQAALVLCGPIIFARHDDLLSYWRPHPGPLAGLRCRCRTGTDCRPAPSSRRPEWGWGVCRERPWWPSRSRACRSRTAGRRS